MGNQINKHTTKLLEEVQLTIAQVGTQQTIQILKVGRRGNVFKSDLRLIAAAVCRSFNLDESTLFGEERKYPRRQAFGVWAYIAFDDKKFALKDLVSYSGSSDSSLSQAKKIIEDLIGKKEATDLLSHLDKKILVQLDDSRRFLQELLHPQSA